MSRRGFTLFEALVVASVLGLLALFSLPDLSRAGEERLVDEATSELRRIEIGQRLYHIQFGRYARTLAELAEEGLVDPSLPSRTEPFRFVLVRNRSTALGREHFTVLARRAPDPVWSGELEVNEDGKIRGFIEDRNGFRIVPFPD